MNTKYMTKKLAPFSPFWSNVKSWEDAVYTLYYIQFRFCAVWMFLKTTNHKSSIFWDDLKHKNPFWMESPGHRWKSRRMFLCISCQRMAESSDLNSPNLMVISLFTMFLWFPWLHVVWLSLLPAHVYSQHSVDIYINIDIRIRKYIYTIIYTLQIVLVTVLCTGTRYFNHMKNIVSWSWDESSALRCKWYPFEVTCPGGKPGQQQCHAAGDGEISWRQGWWIIGAPLDIHQYSFTVYYNTSINT